MPRVCTVCTHPKRKAIDLAFVRSDGSKRRIAAQYHISPTAVRRHAKHILSGMIKANEAREVANAESLVAQVRKLQDRTEIIWERAERDEDGKLGLGAIREARGILELLAKLAGEIDSRPQVNILFSPEWLRVRSVLLESLMPFPEARVAVARSLVALESNNGDRR